VRKTFMKKFQQMLFFSKLKIKTSTFSFSLSHQTTCDT